MHIIPRNAPVTLSQIAKTCAGLVVGDANTEVSRISSLDDNLPGSLSFCTKASPAAIRKVLQVCRVSALFIKNSVNVSSLGTTINLILVKDPLAAVIAVIPLFIERRSSVEHISSLADIHRSARLGNNVAVGAFCSIGAEATIGDDTVIYPNVVIYPRVSVGKRVVLHSGAVIRENCVIDDDIVVQNGAVIGSDGFGYVPGTNGLCAVPQVGNVHLSMHVDVGANTCIDRSTLGTTLIGVGSKIDNLVQIGHNTTIGTHAVLCGQVAIAGSCKIGNGVVLGGNVGVADHICVADGVRVAAKAGVIVDITHKGDYAGHPPVPLIQWKRQMLALEKAAKRGVGAPRVNSSLPHESADE